MNDIIHELEQYRLEHRITQVQLAAIFGVSFVTVNRWLNRHAIPSKIQAYHIEKFLRSKRKKK